MYFVKPFVDGSLLVSDIFEFIFHKYLQPIFTFQKISSIHAIDFYLNVYIDFMLTEILFDFYFNKRVR